MVEKRFPSTLFCNWDIICSFILFLLFLNYFEISKAYGDSDKKKQAEEIKKELSRKKEQFLEFSSKEKSFLGELSEIEKDIAQKRSLIKSLEEKIHLQKKIQKRQEEELKELDQRIQRIRNRLNKRLVAYYKNAKRGYMHVLITTEHLNQLRMNLHSLQTIMNEDQRLLAQMADLREKHGKGISSIRDRIRLIGEMEKEESDRLKSIQEDLDRKVLFLVKVHKEKEFYETAVNELQIAASDLKKTILHLDKDQERILTSSLPPGFSDRKGKLPLPCEGKVVKDANPLVSKIPPAHKGIYIEGPLGTEIKAVFPGRVDFSGWLKGYGQIIIINHGSRFFTVSAHLSERYKEEGDNVEKGEVIGLLGETGSLLGPRLYFEMRKAGGNLDPLEWLKVH